MVKFIMMVGPVGGGKSTVAKQFPVGWVVSADQIRYDLFGDDYYTAKRYSPKDNPQVFAAVEEIVDARVRNGLPVVIDETHIDRKARFRSMRAVRYLYRNPEGFAASDVEYWVCDRPLEEKLATLDWRSPELVEAYHYRFQTTKAEILGGDGLPFVTVKNFIKNT